MPEQPSGPYVFISYRSTDRDHALALADLLQAAGLRVWLDRRSIEGGASWDEAIVEAIRRCTVFAVLCSHAAMESPNILQELRLAQQYRKPMLPLLLDAVTYPAAMEYILAGRQWVELLERPQDVWLPAVLRALSGLGLEPAVPAAPRASGGRTPFVGRQQELATLTAHLATAARGKGRAVLVAGEPGIGKSRLLAELSDQAAATGWQVLAGRAYDSEGMPPYLPFLEALRGYVRSCASDALRSQLGPGAAEVALLVREVRERLPDLAPSPALSAEHERYRLFESITDFLLAIARSSLAGLLLVLDDLHWADKPTLLLLLHLARRCADAPILVAGAYRTTDLSRMHPLAEVLAELRRERLADRLALGSLPLDDASTLISTVAGTPPAPALAAALYRETDGNAFFLEEVVRQLLAEGRDLTVETPSLGEWELPEGVREVIGRRLSRLSSAANALLPAAAVLGDGATIDVLAAVTGLEWAALTGVLEESTAAGMLREEKGAYSFTHALIRQTVFDELSLPRQQRLHLVAAEAIERVYVRNLTPHIAAVANHYRLAGALADPDKVLACVQQAGEIAWEVLAWEDAAGYLESALELLTAQGQGNTEPACDLLLRLGDAQFRVGDRQAAQATYQRVVAVARILHAPERLARAAFGSSVDMPWGYVLPVAEVHALLEEAVATLDTGDSALRVRLLAQLAVVIAILREPGKDWLARSRAIGEAAVAMGHRVGDTAALLVALRGLQSVLWQPAHLEERRAIIADSIRLADAAGERESALGARFWSLMMLLEAGDRAAFDRELATFDRLSETIRLPYYRWLVLVLRAMGALLEGRFTESERLAAEAEAMGKGVQGRLAVLLHSIHIFTLCVQQGRLEDWVRVYHTGTVQLLAVEAFFRAGDAVNAIALDAITAYLHCEAGRKQDAAPLFARAAGALVRTADSTPDLYFLGIVAVPTCVALGDQRTAAALYDCLLPAQVQNANPSYAPVCGPPVAYHLGLLATLLQRWEAAEQHFAFALAMNTRMRAHPYRAHTLRAWGEMLLARHESDDLDRARTLLGEAVALYDELGMAHFAAKTRAALEDLAASTRAERS